MIMILSDLHEGREQYMQTLPVRMHVILKSLLHVCVIIQRAALQLLCFVSGVNRKLQDNKSKVINAKFINKSSLPWWRGLAYVDTLESETLQFLHVASSLFK